MYTVHVWLTLVGRIRTYIPPARTYMPPVYHEVFQDLGVFLLSLSFTSAVPSS